MAALPNDVRDYLITEFRAHLYAQNGFVPFPHQAEWQLASDGLALTDQPPPDDPTIMPEGAISTQVRLPDGSVVSRLALTRPKGRARVIADLGAFKVGKSKGAGMWAAAFATVPDGRVSLVGLEYDICAPEFEYICEALLSDRGMGMKYDSLQNRPRDGRMWLDLPNGFRLDARSWERKDTLKGKEVDAYVFCEAFMLPDLSCYTGVKQNLAVRQGYALFPTTPDRPWVEDLHDRGHGDPEFPDWHCTCSVPRTVNPYSFDAQEMAQAEGLMTAEKFAIAYKGQMGEYVGRVYDYQRGQMQFTTRTHAHMWVDPTMPATMANLRIPDGWQVMGAADTGTYMSGLLVAFDPGGDAFVIYEQPNYDYRSHQIELDHQSSIPAWAMQMRAAMTRFGVHGLWADQNSQYKAELRNNHDIALLPARTNLQTRTEIAREYLKAKRVWFAPWLHILPYELENATWPEEATASGKFERLKAQDHTLDGCEHILARRPIGNVMQPTRPMTWAETQGLRSKVRPGNPHLGSA